MRNKLTNFDLKNICTRYAHDDVSMKILANDYGCSTSLISKSIHKAIVLGFVDEKTAEKLKRKADENMDKKMREMRIS